MFNSAQYEARVDIRALIASGYVNQTTAADIARISRSQLIRLLKGLNVDADISGINRAVIKCLFCTKSGLAADSQLHELALRRNETDALVKAQAWMRNQTAAGPIKLSLLDELAVNSLDLQISLYSSLPDPTKRRAFDFAAGAERLALVQLAFASEEDMDGDFTSQLIGLRFIGNLLFFAWEIDELNGITDGTGPHTQRIAQAFSEYNIFRRARRIAAVIGDARLAYQTAEAAALGGHYVSAARALETSMKMTNHPTEDIATWCPEWLNVNPATEPYFQAAIEFLASEERKGTRNA